ncbi:uncharacterized protein LOC120168161 [Hibiscus syriacus]|uniref:uncharacterized protein LOC120168161 n=1 Tax=Hibiscus syriacus TaxID=106335 RepID=UPI00192381AA|nr:uncharacterized protein LOC120168161 [Hibiscus syriacus]
MYCFTFYYQARLFTQRGKHGISIYRLETTQKTWSFVLPSLAPHEKIDRLFEILLTGEADGRLLRKHRRIVVSLLFFYLEEPKEARTLLGRNEYQKGNIEAALHVFEGIDIAAITPKMKLGLTRKVEMRKRL